MYFSEQITISLIIGFLSTRNLWTHIRPSWTSFYFEIEDAKFMYLFAWSNTEKREKCDVFSILRHQTAVRNYKNDLLKHSHNE